MTLNILAIAVATVAGMAVGALWFSQALLGRPWAAAAGVRLGAARPWVYAAALVATAATAVVLDAAAVVAHAALGGPFLLVAVAAAVAGWAGLTAARSGVEYLFERRSARLYVIDMGHQLAVVAVMGVVIGLFGN